MPFSMAEVVNDPDFAQVFGILRSQGGSWQAGKWIDNNIGVAGYGVVQPAKPNELNQVPEGDRVTGAVTFHSSSMIYETHTNGPNDPNAGTSDVIAWNNQNWRIVKVWPWQDFGYYKALGVRMSGQ